MVLWINLYDLSQLRPLIIVSLLALTLGCFVAWLLRNSLRRERNQLVYSTYSAEDKIVNNGFGIAALLALSSLFVPMMEYLIFSSWVILFFCRCLTIRVISAYVLGAIVVGIWTYVVYCLGWMTCPYVLFPPTWWAYIPLAAALLGQITLFNLVSK